MTAPPPATPAPDHGAVLDPAWILTDFMNHLRREGELDDLTERAMKAALAALTERDQGRWEPIETAPRDGASVLVWWPTMALNERGLLSNTVIGGEQILTGWQLGSWFRPEIMTGSSGFYQDWEFARDPTHWQPLPAPPVRP